MPSWIYIACFTLSTLFSADFTLETTIDAQGMSFTIDRLGGIYLIEKDGIKKYQSTGNLQFEYSLKTLGEISSVDASNALRILVFYRDLNQVVVLDNTLSIQGEAISLEEYNMDQVTLVASSNNNALWFYDRSNFQLVRTDKQLNELQNTGNLGQILGIELMPNYLVERNGQVYLNNPETGILVFDIYGTYYKTIPLLGLDKFQVTDEGILYADKAGLSYYHFKSLTSSPVELPRGDYLDVQINDKQVFVQTKSAIEVYRSRP